MSGRMVKDVLEHAPESLTRLELLVLVSLAESALEGTRSTRGGSAAVNVIAGRVRSTPGSVRNALSTLQARALIKPLERARRGTAQRYYLTPLTEYHREL